MSEHIKYSIVGILAAALLFGSCKKEEALLSGLSADNVTIYQDEDVQEAIGAVAGSGVVLLIYIDTAGDYQFKLIDNSGVEIWKKTFGYSIGRNNSYPNLKVIYDIDETFAFFEAMEDTVALKKINLQGDIVFNERNFFKGSFTNASFNFSVAEVMLGNNNNYLVLGNGYFSGNRAFVGEYSRTGQENFFKLYTVNVLGTNTYTSGFINDKGGYTVAGSFASATPGLKSAFFVSFLDVNGNVLKTTKTDVDSIACYGKELLNLSSGNLGYLISPDGNSVDGRSRLFRLNDAGEKTGLDFLDLARENYGVGDSPYIGNGLVQNSDGTYAGLMKTKIDATGFFLGNYYYSNYRQPTYSYTYFLDQNASVVSQNYINKNYSNYYNAVVRMSNGKTMLFGTTLSLGEELKLTTMEL